MSNWMFDLTCTYILSFKLVFKSIEKRFGKFVDLVGIVGQIEGYDKTVGQMARHLRPHLSARPVVLREINVMLMYMSNIGCSIHV